MHKYAHELKSGDILCLAGNLVKVIDVYETNKSDVVKILFANPSGQKNTYVAGSMDVRDETLFILN